jgi:hypothetical protein
MCRPGSAPSLRARPALAASRRSLPPLAIPAAAAAVAAAAPSMDGEIEAAGSSVGACAEARGGWRRRSVSSHVGAVCLCC